MDLNNIFNLAGLMGIDMDDADREKFEKVMAIGRADTSDVAKLRCITAVLLNIPESDIPEFKSANEVKSYLTQMVHPSQRAQVKGIFGFIEQTVASSKSPESVRLVNNSKDHYTKVRLNSGDDESNSDAQAW